jgi:hypothetical protein
MRNAFACKGLILVGQNLGLGQIQGRPSMRSSNRNCRLTVFGYALARCPPHSRRHGTIRTMVLDTVTSGSTLFLSMACRIVMACKLDR